MQRLLAACFAIVTMASFGQTKYDFVQFDKLIELRGTHFVIATIENHGKTLASSNEHLLFIDTKNGKTKQISFPAGALIQTVEQVKIDSLEINKLSLESTRSACIKPPHTPPSQQVYCQAKAHASVHLTP